MDIIQNWREEKRSAYLYRIMSYYETHPLRKNLFQQLATAAEEQAHLWSDKINDPTLSKEYKPDTRTRFISWLIKWVGVSTLRYILSAMKIRGMSIYAHERRHTNTSTASNIRAAVFGVNDGLISNMSLILGIYGAQADHAFIILTGVAGLLAGACSMGAGEYISVKSQREVYEHQIALEKKELDLYPEEELEELSIIYQARGISKQEANHLASVLINNPSTALDTLAREELGLNPMDLGSPISAMLASFFSFSFGAAIPLMPFLLNIHFHPLTLSLVLTTIILFLIGMLISLYTNRNLFISGLRMLFIGSLAGLITYFIGRTLGITLH